MNTLPEEEESTKGSPYDSTSMAGDNIPLAPEAPSTSRSADPEEKREIPLTAEGQFTPRPHRRPSTFETVFQVLRHPSLGNIRNYARRGSHANLDLGRRGSPGSSEMQIPSRALEVPRGSRGLVIPPNHVSFRRPSGIVTFNPDLMNSHQKRYILGLLEGNSDGNISLPEPTSDTQRKKDKPQKCKRGNDDFVSVMSAFYAKCLFVMGIAFPITEVLSSRVSIHYYQGFYLFLYLGSLAFMTFMYMTLLKDRAITQLLKSSLDVEEDDIERIQSRRSKRPIKRVERYGSFYLRLGAVAFGIGSMVYSGLEFGQYFELKEDSQCHNLVQAVTPVARMILTLVQMQFIFLNSRHMEMSRYRSIARFGLMHMIATNLCEWMYVIVEETKHEIIHIAGHKAHPEDHEEDHHRHTRGTGEHDIYECRRTNVMGSLVQDASPFLFPCTIEYSLICAVIIYEMWKTVKNGADENSENKQSILRHSSKSSMDFEKSNNHFSVDCSNAHKGLFSGILILVITIISLIMFFVMNKDPVYKAIAIYEVYLWELVMYVITTAVVIAGGWQMRFLKYNVKQRRSGLGLDNILLMWAQSGIFIYCMFSTIGCYFMVPVLSPEGLIPELLNLLQSTAQTVFILDGTFRRTETPEQNHRKPGRQIITFLLVTNMALWLINTLQKSRAEFRPTHMKFYGHWAWTIITHVSMPLAIFFRFHSTICLFEVWKNAYKFKLDHHRVHLLGTTAEH